jgi:hypothetical protein
MKVIKLEDEEYYIVRSALQTAVSCGRKSIDLAMQIGALEGPAAEIARHIGKIEKLYDRLKEQDPHPDTEIRTIMEAYHRKRWGDNGAGTPGGLDGMPDVWQLLKRWDAVLRMPVGIE